MRLIKKGNLYKLIELQQPIIVNHGSTLMNDNNKGGALLRYVVTEIRYISLFNYNYALFSVNSVKKNVRFFNPLKRDWNRKAYKIDKLHWGKRNRLLTNLWLIVDNDFKDIFSVTTSQLKSFSHCKDDELIKNLKSRKEVFITNQNSKSKKRRYE